VPLPAACTFSGVTTAVSRKLSSESVEWEGRPATPLAISSEKVERGGAPGRSPRAYLRKVLSGEGRQGAPLFYRAVATAVLFR
jgi:hypothetical protein